jgi:hypothetical protein
MKRKRGSIPEVINNKFRDTNKNVGKAKKALTILAAAAVILFIAAPARFPDNADFTAGLNEITPNRAVIVFNSGGWGYTPPQEAADFAPILRGIQDTLSAANYHPEVISYERTEKSFLGRITGLRGFISSFNFQSSALADQLEEHLKENPEGKIIITGLSNGAAFTNQVIEKMGKEAAGQVLAIEVGTPFWEKPIRADNVLFLDNNGQDSLADGKIPSLLLALVKAPFRLVSAKLCGTSLSFSRSIQAPGHEYTWNSSTGSDIIQFLAKNLPRL